MATETGDQVSRSPWYAKFFEYWKNRNRIGPGRVELPDCDFFIVAPRRTLRVLRPTLKSGLYYENTGERPESINDNFFNRWSRRPHSSGNCRCSFRQSSRLSSTEEQIISAELNRIRTSLCEAEKSGQDIEQLEKRLSVDLQKFQAPGCEVTIEQNDRAEKIGGFDQPIDEQSIKNKIVRDLERYINNLLEEMLDDTVKFIAEGEENLVRSGKTSRKMNNEEGMLSTEEQARKNSGRNSLDDISFSFHGEDKKANRNDDSKDVGYINRAFVGSTNDPDSLDFYLRRSLDTEVILEPLDCIDSGINSVETIEFQPEQEPSLEQSLLRIIDEKLGRTPLGTSWEDLNTERSPVTDSKEKNGVAAAREEPKKSDDERWRIRGDKEGEVQRQKRNTGSEVSSGDSRRSEAARNAESKVHDISGDNLSGPEDLRELEDAGNEPTFEKLRLEFKDSGKEAPLRTEILGKLASLDSAKEEAGKKGGIKRETTPIELEDYRKTFPEIEEINSDEITPSDRSLEGPKDFVAVRKNRKPMIVFLHGFGSSAEAFEHQLEYFSALGYPCIAPDMLGHGMSSAPGRTRDYHFSKLLKDLDAVLHHYAFRPGQKCVLVAHNYGCSFATALACKYDSNIHQLVLISGGGPTPLAPPSTESVGHCCLRAVLAPFLMCGMPKGILYSARGRQHPYCGPEPAEQWPSHMKYVLDGMVWPEGDYVFHRRISTPTLLIHGLRDNKVSLVQECQMERTMIKAFLEAIPAAGHSPMTDCPEQLNHMIHCFIDLWKNKKW